MEQVYKPYRFPAAVNKIHITDENKLDIMEIVASYCGVTIEDMVAHKTDRKYVLARHQAMYFYLHFTHLTLQEIGRLFERHHTTVIYARNLINDLLDINHDNIRLEMRKLYTRIEKYAEKHPTMKLIYIAHPVGGDVDKNIRRIIGIVRDINRSESGIVPFVPYMADLMALDDDNIRERSRGLQNGHIIISRSQIDECRVYGNMISSGMRREIMAFLNRGIPIKIMNPKLEAEFNELHKKLKNE